VLDVTSPMPGLSLADHAEAPDLQIVPNLATAPDNPRGVSFDAARLRATRAGTGMSMRARPRQGGAVARLLSRPPAID
jgi:hypothetical protein